MKTSVFAIEGCWPYEPSFHDELRRFVQSGPPSSSVGDKWTYYQNIFGALAENVASLSRGIWDYFDDDTAKKHYLDYASTLTSKKGARKQPLEAPDPYRGGEPRFLTVTGAFLLVRDSPCDQAMRSLCAIPDSQLWKRATFLRLLRGMGTLSFASVESDTVYLIPRDGEYALTTEDLDSATFDYLRVVQD